MLKNRENYTLFKLTSGFSGQPVRILVMYVLKKIALGILSPIFIFLLFATAFDVGFVRTATHPATVKKLVAESGVYDSLVPNILQQTKTIETPLGNFSTTDPAVQKAAARAVTPQYVKQNAEAAIDNIYQWLDGKADQPTFKFDLAGPKTSFANSVAGTVQQRLAGLPTCTNSQSAQILLNGQFDVNDISCLPRGVSTQTAADQVKSGLSGSDFLDKVTLNANQIGNRTNACQSLSPDCGVHNFFTDHQNLPKQYQRAKKTPLILSILTILTAAGIVFLSSSWQKGLRHIGINLAVIGVIMLIFSYALNRAVSTKIVPKIKLDNAVLQQDIRSLATDVSQQIDKNYWFFGALYTVLGAGGIILSRRGVPGTGRDKTATEQTS